MKRLFAIIFLFVTLLPAGIGAGSVVLAADQPGQQTVIELTNPIGGTETNKKGQTDWYKFLGRAVQIGLGILGSVTLAVFMYGGFLWLTSGGNEEKITHGLKTMLYAAFGVFIIFGAYAILNTILTGLTTGGGNSQAAPDILSGARTSAALPRVSDVQPASADQFSTCECYLTVVSDGFGFQCNVDKRRSFVMGQPANIMDILSELNDPHCNEAVQDQARAALTNAIQSGALVSSANMTPTLCSSINYSGSQSVLINTYEYAVQCSPQ